MIVYGIKNCDTVKKSLTWLKDNNFNFEFHDYKKEGISETKLKTWCEQISWEILLNKRGTTWKKLDEKTQKSIQGKSEAIALMKEQTSIIKRPIIEKGDKIVLVGFNEEEYIKMLKK